jgi:hypothetical protein
MKIKDILLEIEVNEWRDCFLRSIPNIKNWFKKWFEEAKIDFLTESVLPIFIDDKGNIFKENSVIFENISKKFLTREPNHVKKDELMSIGKWKTPRQEQNLNENTEELIREVSQEVMNTLDDKKKMFILVKGIDNNKNKKLKGIGVAVASAILTVLYPDRFCVIDYRAKRALCILKKKGELESYDTLSFRSYQDFLKTYEIINNTSDISLYFKYLEIIKDICGVIGPNITPRMLEVALWKYDKNKD